MTEIHGQDPSAEPAPAPPPESGRKRTRKRQAAAAGRNPKRACLLTDLARRDGRRLMEALDEQLAASAPGWRLSTRHLADQSANDLKLTSAEVIIFDADDPDLARLAAQACRRFIATPAMPLATLDGPQICIDQRLAGMAAADALLRRGHRRFAWGGNGNAGDSALAGGFIEELRRAELEADALQSAGNAEAPTALLCDSMADFDDEVLAAADLAVATIDRRQLPGAAITPLVVDRSARWLASILVEALEPGPGAGSLAAIPPRTLDETEINELPAAFADNEIERVSGFIDEQLASARPVSVDLLASHAGLPRRTLERRFREAFGNSIHREITRRQVARARQHLLHPAATPASAAAAAAYPTTRMLSINFTKLHGIGPRAFQRDFFSAIS